MADNNHNHPLVGTNGMTRNNGVNNYNMDDRESDPETEEEERFQSSFWEQRRLLYGIYDTADEMRAEMERYGVVGQPEQTILRPQQEPGFRRRDLLDSRLNTAGGATSSHGQSASLVRSSAEVAPFSLGELATFATTTTTTKSTHFPGPTALTSTTTAPSSSSNTTATTTSIGGRGKDIWGNYPVKEPKEMIPCPICNRSVSVLRFAPHLDKCMGFGNTTRAAATSSSSSLAVGSTNGASTMMPSNHDVLIHNSNINSYFNNIHHSNPHNMMMMMMNHLGGGSDSDRINGNNMTHISSRPGTLPATAANGRASTSSSGNGTLRSSSLEAMSNLG
ncbi:hypothetical protein ACA910_013983 [Epithemia clementina (nom. ined.)]